MIVKVAFLDRFKDALLDGRKTMTCRTYRLGKEGDTFTAFGATFIIETVVRTRLGDMPMHYDVEGVSSPEEFRKLWAQLHSRKGFVPDQMVYAHRIRRIAQTVLENPGSRERGQLSLEQAIR